MSELQKNLSMEEMFDNAEKNGDYKILEDHLEEIKNRLKPSNPVRPTPEQIRSAYEFARLLQKRKGEFDKMKGNEQEKTATALKNLKEEIELHSQIKTELEKLSEIRLSNTAYFNNPNNSGEQIIVNFYLKRIDDNNFVITANSKDVSTSRKLSSLAEIEKYVEEIQNSSYEKLVDQTSKDKEAIDYTKKRLEENNKPKVEKVAIATKGIGEKPREVSQDKKEEKVEKNKKGISELDKSSVKEQKVEIPSDELDAAKEVFGFEIDKTNFRQAINILNKNTNPTTKESWEKAGYENSTWFFRDIELEQLTALSNYKKSNPDVIKNINIYYNSGESIITYLKDKKNLEKNYSSKTVFEYLSNRESRPGNINESQILTILNKNENNPEIFKTIKKIITLAGGKIGDFNSKEELFSELKKNPGNKLAFIKGIDTVASSSMDLGYYFEDGGETKNYRENLQKGYEKLNLKLEQTFDKKYNEILEITKVEAEKLTGDKKKEALEKIKLLESLEQKTKLKDYFKFKSLSLLGSLVEGKQGGGALLVIGNNSENSIINKIDLELGFFTTVEGKFLPGVGLSISDSYDVTDTVKISGKAGVNIFGAYIIAGADKMVNYDQIKNASFESFATTSKRVGLYGNAAIGFTGGFSYGGGVYYKESAVEGINKKEKQLSSVIDQFKKINSIEEIDSLKLDGLNEENSAKIKEDMKNILVGLDFDKETTTIGKAQIIDMAKKSKIEMFRHVASKIAEDKGWNWNGAALGVQFLAGFFPIPVIGISFEKVTRDFKLDKQKEIQDNIITLGSLETTKDYDKVSKKINKKLGTNMKFNPETGFYEIDGYDDKTGTIKNSKGKEIKIEYSSEYAKNIKIDGNKLIIGDVKNILAISKIGLKSEENTLILGGGGNEIEKGGTNKFSSNNPEGFIKKGAEKVEKIESLSTGFVTGFRQFIDKNIGRFNEGIASYKSRQSRLFIDFSEALDSGKIDIAKSKMVEFLKLQRRFLKGINKNEGDSKEDINVTGFISLLEKEENIQNISLILQEFADALMTDRNTLNRVNHSRNAKSIKESNYQMATTNYFGKGTNRKSAFERMATKEFGENAYIVKNIRHHRVEEDKNKFGWNVDTKAGEDIFAVVASYKIAKDSHDKVHSLGKRFLAMPPGTTSVADGKIMDITGSNENALFETLFKDSLYKESIKNTLAKTIKNIDKDFKTSDLSDEKLKELILNKEKGIIINGKNISLPEAKFVFFMYGRCYNEAVGLKMGQLKVIIPGEAPKFAPVNLATGGGVDSQVVDMGAKEFNLGVAGTGADKKPENSIPKGSSTPTTTDTGSTTEGGNATGPGQNGGNSINGGFNP